MHKLLQPCHNERKREFRTEGWCHIVSIAIILSVAVQTRVQSLGMRFETSFTLDFHRRQRPGIEPRPCTSHPPPTSW